MDKFRQASDSELVVVEVVPGEPLFAGTGVVVVVVGVVSPSTVFGIPSSILGTIKLSLDIKLYLITKDVNLLQRWNLASKSSNNVL
jgi:hypothetical protein